MPLADGIVVEGDTIFRIESGARTAIAGIAGIGSLRGVHNAQNAAFAAAAATALGVGTDVKGLRSFPGLAHRMEQVGRAGTTLFVNDSKGTNADATAKALASFSDIFWIAGGKAKEGGIESLSEFFPKIRKAYLIGEAADAFAATLEGKVPYEISVTLDVAVGHAARDAAEAALPDAVVLLSPACASFDQFRNFEIRGTSRFNRASHFVSPPAKAGGPVNIGSGERGDRRVLDPRSAHAVAVLGVDDRRVFQSFHIPLTFWQPRWRTNRDHLPRTHSLKGVRCSREIM
eukprot:gene8892-12026_t